MNLVAHLPGYELLRVSLNEKGELSNIDLECSPETLELFQWCSKEFGLILSDWKFPSTRAKVFGDSEREVLFEGFRVPRRSVLLIHELILKARGQWVIPYGSEIVCTCRNVPGDQIDQSVLGGAFSVDEVSLWTTACTSCTSCKSKIEEILNHRLQHVNLSDR